jgi:hypothetical protein
LAVVIARELRNAREPRNDEELTSNAEARTEVTRTEVTRTEVTRTEVTSNAVANE